MFVLPNESTTIPPSGLYLHPNCLPKSEACINWGITKPPFLDMLSPFSKTIFFYLSIFSNKVFNFIFYYFYSLILKQTFLRRILKGLTIICTYNQVFRPIINSLNEMKTLNLFIYNNNQRFVS